MNAFKRIINSLKDKRNEAHEKNVRKRAELMFQVTEYDHELWFTHNGMLFCPCCMISGEPTDVYQNLGRYIMQEMCKNDIFCMGVQCPVKKQCLRYTKRIDTAGHCGFIRKCTNQRLYVQDKDKIVESINNIL